MIELQSLTTGYKGKVVSRNLNAQLQTGQLTCMIGSNGAGKSTLLRTIANFQPALSGQVILGEKAITEYNSGELSRLISIVLTDNTHIKGLTTFEVVGMGRSPYTGFWGRLSEEDRRIVEQCIGRVGINHVSQQQIQTLSDGERQKTMIAKAIAQETPIILLDEPTAFLYYPNKVEVMLMLRQLAHETGKTILMSIHDIELALQIADNIWLLNEQGELIHGTPRELGNNGTIDKYATNGNITFDSQSLTFRVKL